MQTVSLEIPTTTFAALGELSKEMIGQRVGEYFNSEQLPRLSNNVG